MVRDLTTEPRSREATKDHEGRKSGLWWMGGLMGIVLAGLLWHVLACVESPLGYAPDSNALALTISEPYSLDNNKGESLYRLLVLAEAKKPDAKNLRVVEESKAVMLTGPSYSPDGTQYAYLRIGRKEFLRLSDSEAATQPATFPATTLVKPGEPAAEPVKLTVEEKAGGAKEAPEKAKALDALLVIRDAKTDAVRTTRKLALHLSEMPPYEYLTLRWGKDGKWLYLTDGASLQGIQIQEATGWLLWRQAALLALSPDGQTLAFCWEKTVVFVSLDRSWTREQAMDQDLSPGGLIWLDDQHVMVPGAKSESVAIVEKGKDSVKWTDLKLPPAGDNKRDTGPELAAYGVGAAQRIVAAFGDSVFFCDGAGKLLKEIKKDEKVLWVQPTFSPDGQQVAFKRLTSAKPADAAAATDTPQVKDLVFFTPDGEEKARVTIPPTK